MAATKSDIRSWLERGKQDGASHMLVVCDTFDWDDYPVYTATVEQARERAKAYPRDMQKLMEVYKIDADWEPQLNAGRSFNY